MKYQLALVILAVVATQIVIAQNGDQQPPGGDNGKPEAPIPKLAVHRFRRQVPVPSGGGQMGGGGNIGFSAGGQVGGQAGGEGGADGKAGGQAGASGQAGAQFGATAGVSGGANGGAKPN